MYFDYSTDQYHLDLNAADLMAGDSVPSSPNVKSNGIVNETIGLAGSRLQATNIGAGRCKAIGTLLKSAVEFNPDKVLYRIKCNAILSHSGGYTHIACGNTSANVDGTDQIAAYRLLASSERGSGVSIDDIIALDHPTGSSGAVAFFVMFCNANNSTASNVQLGFSMSVHRLIGPAPRYVDRRIG